MRSKQKAGSDKPKQGAGSGGAKMANDSSKAAAQSLTPKSDGKGEGKSAGQRTPVSRSDRDDKLGSGNQTRSRKGG